MPRERAPLAPSPRTTHGSPSHRAPTPLMEPITAELAKKFQLAKRRRDGEVLFGRSDVPSERRVRLGERYVGRAAVHGCCRFDEIEHGLRSAAATVFSSF